MINLLFFALACTGNRDASEGWDMPDRQPGERNPLTEICDPQDEINCLLPWPSSRFERADPDATTGVRVSVDASALPVEDDPRGLNVADGFSRITGIATAFQARLDATTLIDGQSIQLLVAEPSDPAYGALIPLVPEVVQGGGDVTPWDLVIGRPRQPMPANAEMVAVVTDSLLTEDGVALEPDPWTRLALEFSDPSTEEEAAWAAYNAPTRALLDAAGINRATVLRVWDFTTRSAEDPTLRLRAIQEADTTALAAGQVSVVIDEVELSPAPVIAAIVTGHLSGLPEYRDETGAFSQDDAGRLGRATGTRDTVFRVVIPAGEGDYAVAMYGHGTGGNVDDDAFDEDAAAEGVAKVGVRWSGWTDDTVFSTFGHLANAALAGTERSTAGLVTSVADVSALVQALDGVLGDALAAATLGEVANPAAGRRPDTTEPLWIGGSLGGTMGAVTTLADDRIRYGVINVPGGGWTHFIPPSSTYAMLRDVFISVYGDALDASLAMVMTQGAWDDADGAAWADFSNGDVFLMQESIGDPILPNIGTEILAAALEATQLDPSIEDIPRLAHGEALEGATGLEQYAVPTSEGEYGIHGFAARDTPAGAAAAEQIFEFLTSALAGAPLITHPDGCATVTADGSCDFRSAW